MSNRWVGFLLLFTALWLPVQTIAALSMPLCRHAPGQRGAADATKPSAAEMPCHEAHEAAAADQAANDAGCDNCTICHMACAGFIPSAPLATSPISPGHDYTRPALVAPQSHIAEPPQHPPKHSA